MYVHFKRDLLENKKYNHFNILLYIAIFSFDFHPRKFLKIAPINIAMVIFINIPYIQTSLSGYPFCSMRVMLTVSYSHLKTKPPYHLSHLPTAKSQTSLF